MATVGLLLKVLWGYSDASACIVAPLTVASEYRHGTLSGTPTCSTHSGTCENMRPTWLVKGDSECVLNALN